MTARPAGVRPASPASTRIGAPVEGGAAARTLATIRILAVILTLVIAALACLPAIDAPFTYDETGGIQENRAVRPGATLASALAYRYSPDQARPLFFLSLWADGRLFGLSPRPFRLTSLLLHLLCGLAVYLLLRRLPLPGAGEAGTAPRPAGPALAGTALFLLHPLQSESVIYIWGRSELLATLFGIVALGLGSLALGADERPGSTGRLQRLGAWAAAVVSLTMALASKEDAVALPVIALVWWTLAERHSLRRAAAGAAILAIPVALFLAFRGLALGAMGRQLYVRSVSENILGQAVVTLRMLRLAILPVGQTVDPPAEIPGLAAGLLAVLICVAGLAGAAFLPRAFPGSAGARRVAGGALIAFTGYLIYWVVPLPDLMSERRAYLPLLGAALALAGALALIVGPRRLERPGRKHGITRPAGGAARREGPAALLLPASVVALLFAPAMTVRARVWADPRRLWEEAARAAPRKARPLINLGVLAVERGERARAAELFDRAIALEPGNGEARYNRARLRLDGNDLQGARSDLEAAVSTNPGMVRARINLGIVDIKLRDLRAAEEALRAALETDPGEPRALTNLAEMLRANGRVAEALTLYRVALESDPTYAYAAARLGVALEALGDRHGALAAYREYLARAPAKSSDRDLVLKKIETLEAAAAGEPPPASPSAGGPTASPAGPGSAAPAASPTALSPGGGRRPASR